MQKISDLEAQLAKTQWLYDKKNIENTEPFVPYYGDVTELNTERTILDGVGKETLNTLTSELMDLLDTSVAVYEKNGDYAYGVFNSGWCQLLDASSRKLCNVPDNKTALNCGRWLCHDRCWLASKTSIDEKNTIAMDCVGGLTLFAEPIIAGNEVVGSINIGYGNPPIDDKTLKELSERFDIDFDILKQKALDYKPRPDFIFQIAKKRLKSVARLIGQTIYNKQIEMQLKKQIDEYVELNEEYKRTNEELKSSKEKAEESDRLKTAFLQNMSHEIRTPLNAICGFSGFLNNPDLSNEKRKSFVQIILNSSNQLLSIVTDILTISSLETNQEKLNINKVCINNIIVELLAIFKQQSISQNISLYAKQQLTDKQSEIYTDKTKITQILSNLITNALKFTHEGFIEFGYDLKTDVEPAELQFYVKDTGIGIKPEYQNKIFERFQQAEFSINKKYGGTGLGLAISNAFTDLLGGRIWVQSEPEKGSTFYFTIPYQPVNELDRTILPNKQNENFKTIMVAEDEEYNYLLIEEMLIGYDIKLIHTKDGKETVDIFKSNPDVDLILMDIKMPIMTGDEAAKIIKAIRPDMPIIAQSAYALEHEIEKFSKIFDDYLSKPINSDMLTRIISQHIPIIRQSG